MPTTLEMLVTGTKNGKIVWVDHTTPIENTYYSIFGSFRADISPEKVVLTKHGQVIEEISSDFSSLSSAITTQRASAIEDAKTELGDLIS